MEVVMEGFLKEAEQTQALQSRAGRHYADIQQQSRAGESGEHSLVARGASLGAGQEQVSPGKILP